MQQQFPSAFQFSELYLTALWDSVCLGIFDNFMFDSIRMRQNFCKRRRHEAALMSVWEWDWQYDQEDRSLFNNPLYKARTELDLQIPASHATDQRMGSKPRRMYSLKLTTAYDSIPSQNIEVLRPVSKLALLRLWEHCYLRWITPIQILGGGSPSEYIQQSVLVEEILCLQHKFNSLRRNKLGRQARPSSNLLFSPRLDDTLNENSTAASHQLTSDLALTSSFPYTPEGARLYTNKLDTLVSSFLPERSLIYEADNDCSDSEVLDT